MPKLRTLAPRLRLVDTATVKLPSKVKAQIYTTPEFQRWRALVVERAGGRCEATDPHGHRCTRASPLYRMYADHIHELKDDGSVYDLANGQCLCRSHHELKTVAMRFQRFSRRFERG